MPFSKSFSIHTMPKRHNLPQHLTVSAVIIAKGHTLLIHHKRIGAWLPPGGHVEIDELPHEGAIREVLEETGVLVEILTDDLPDTGDADAFLLPNPLCTHVVRAREKEQDIYHFDIVYLCRPVMVHVELDPLLQLPVLVQNAEVHESRWVPLGGMADLLLAKNVVEVFQLAAKKMDALQPGC
jgi:8-oxo-dGTP pyrophosphatase MutT (NUDIX family)